MDISNLNNGFGPIIDERGHGFWYASVATILSTIGIYIIVAANSSRVALDDLVLLSMFISSIIAGEFFRRFLLVFEEFVHVRKRYASSYKAAMLNCIHFDKNFGTICVIFITTTGIMLYRLFEPNHSIVNLEMYILFAILSSVGSYLLGLKQLSPVEYSHLNEIENKHLAAGLAWGFYFGYLQRQLPELEKLVNDNEKIRKYLKPVMYIIIPKNCQCRDSFQDCDERITFEKNTLEQKRNVGGVHERVYKNSVYKIEKEGYEPEHIIMEYATPVNNLYKMSQHEGCDLTAMDLDREVTLFYKKLKRILEADPNCEGRYKLVLLAKTNGAHNLVDILYRSMNDEEMCVD